jgi:hypothetical protein
MSSKKTTFPSKPMPRSLSDLPRFGITTKQTSSRELIERTDVAFGVRSLSDLDNEFARGFTDLDRPKLSPRGPAKSRRR